MHQDSTQISLSLMAQQRTQLASPVPVISPLFCTINPVDLTIIRKVLTMTGGTFAVTDVNGNILFKVKAPFFSMHSRRLLLDAAGNPIVTLRRKLRSRHNRWQVFRGDSSYAGDLLFSAKRSSVVQFKTKLDVFLSNNLTEEVCDFKVKGSWLGRSCAVYAGESSTIVAQMHMKNTVQNVLLGNKFMVTVYPNIDYAFIIALIVILDEISSGD